MSRSFLAALGLSAGFLAFVAWDQSHWWRVKEDYRFGWLVPFFVAFVLHDRWPRIVAAAEASGAPGSPRARGAGKWLLRGVVSALLAGGAVMFLLGAFYRAGAGTSQPGTLAITMGAVAIVLALLLVNAPEPSSVKSAAEPTRLAGIVALDDPRVKLTALFVFPVLVWLISAPMVSAVETQVNLALLRKIVSVVAFVFQKLGLPIEQQGNVLALPSGNVGVEEACSGIRSLTACIFAGSFLAAVYLEALWKKIALLVAAAALAVATNLGRSLFLTAWAYRYGPDAIAGNVHHATGYAVLGITVAGLVALLPLLSFSAACGGTARLAAKPAPGNPSAVDPL